MRPVTCSKYQQRHDRTIGALQQKAAEEQNSKKRAADQSVIPRMFVAENFFFLDMVTSTAFHVRSERSAGGPTGGQ